MCQEDQEGMHPKALCTSLGAAMLLSSPTLVQKLSSLAPAPTKQEPNFKKGDKCGAPRNSTAGCHLQGWLLGAFAMLLLLHSNWQSHDKHWQWGEPFLSTWLECKSPFMSIFKGQVTRHQPVCKIKESRHSIVFRREYGWMTNAFKTKYESNVFPCTYCLFSNFRYQECLRSMFWVRQR